MKNPIQLIKSAYNKLFYYCAPAKIYLNKQYKAVFGRNINWKNPTTDNEKLQWLKVYGKNSTHAKLVDKYEVREYIKDKIGEKYLIPLLGAWERVEDINFDEIKGLRKEAQQKLNQIKPLNVGQASRISGISPADISVLIVYLKTYRK